MSLLFCFASAASNPFFFSTHSCRSFGDTRDFSRRLAPSGSSRTSEYFRNISNLCGLFPSCEVIEVFSINESRTTQPEGGHWAIYNQTGHLPGTRQSRALAVSPLATPWVGLPDFIVTTPGVWSLAQMASNPGLLLSLGQDARGAGRVLDAALYQLPGLPVRPGQVETHVAE